MNCFCGMVVVFPPLEISDSPCGGFEPAENLSSGFDESWRYSMDEWSCAVVMTTTPTRQKDRYLALRYQRQKFSSKLKFSTLERLSHVTHYCT